MQHTRCLELAHIDRLQLILMLSIVILISLWKRKIHVLLYIISYLHTFWIVVMQRSAVWVMSVCGASVDAINRWKVTLLTVSFSCVRLWWQRMLASVCPLLVDVSIYVKDGEKQTQEGLHSYCLVSHTRTSSRCTVCCPFTRCWGWEIQSALCSNIHGVAVIKAL